MTNLNTQQLNDQDLERATGGVLPHVLPGVTSDMLRSMIIRRRWSSFEGYYQQHKNR